MWSVQSAECNLEDWPLASALLFLFVDEIFAAFQYQQSKQRRHLGQLITRSLCYGTCTDVPALHTLTEAWMSQLCSTYLCPMNYEGLCPMNYEGLWSRRWNQSMARSLRLKWQYVAFKCLWLSIDYRGGSQVLVIVDFLRASFTTKSRWRTLVANWPLNYDSDYLHTVKHCHWTSWARHRL